MPELAEPIVWRRTVRSRLVVVSVVCAFWVVAIFAKLVDLQVFQSKALQAQSDNQRTSLLEVPAQRGDIVDRHGRVLATSVEEDTVWANPRRVKDPQGVAARLCGALGDCDDAKRTALGQQLSRSKKWFVHVRRHVTPDQAQRVAALEIDGIEFMKEPRRCYPNQDLAAAVLGYVGIDNKGLGGLEATYNTPLSGLPGHMTQQVDSNGKAFSRVGAPPVPGKTIELTIDASLQHIAERELRVGVEENRAVGGSVVIMDSTTGEILAMANAPTFDVNDYALVPAENRRNRAVQDIYEPGSTFKIVTASAALEEKVMSPTDPIETGGGTIAIGPKRIIKEAQGHAYGTLSFTDVIVKSSNVGAIKIGFRLGAERLGRYVARFGFGTRLSPDFPTTENAGIVWRPSQWTDGALASVSMGYQIGVTPLQMAAAASTVANGGELVQPRVVRAVIHDNRRTLVPRKVVRRVTSPETAAEMTSIMEGVVERGTGKQAILPDFTVAGKTGTANKNKDGHYLEREFNVSFVGFVPSRKPALTILVLIDTPRGPNRPFGGTVAAPIFQRIADAALRYLAVAPTINPMPPVLVARHDSRSGITVSGPALPLTIIPAASPSTSGQIVLPELRGLSGREALRVLARLGITPRVTGDGVVTEQDPQPGAALETGGSCRLALGRHAPGLRP